MPDPWTPGLFRPLGRSIGGIVAQVTIQEREHDELMITEHPIEQGAPITDHTFKRPSEVQIRAGWTVAGAGDLSANGNGVYGVLLRWQASLAPFVLYTGKRVYNDMLIQSLTVTTDEKSEFSLMADITCRQIIRVRVSTAQASTSQDPAAHEEPDKTASGSDKGTTPTRDIGTGGKMTAAPPGGVAGAESLPDLPPEQTVGVGGAETLPDLPPTTEGTKVETKVMENNSPGVLGGKEFTAPIPPAPGSPTPPTRMLGKVFTPAILRLMREGTWQQTSRYRPSGGARSQRG